MPTVKGEEPETVRRGTVQRLQTHNEIKVFSFFLLRKQRTYVEIMYVPSTLTVFERPASMT